MTTPTTSDAHAAWEAVLDRLELDLVQSERMLATGEFVPPEPWEVPRVEGPIPTGLLPRAHDIQRRQAEIRSALRVALTSNGRQRAYTDRVTQSRDTGLTPPAYVDLNA
jgi:hypothetical protein